MSLNRGLLKRDMTKSSCTKLHRLLVLPNKAHDSILGFENKLTSHCILRQVQTTRKAIESHSRCTFKLYLQKCMCQVDIAIKIVKIDMMPLVSCWNMLAKIIHSRESIGKATPIVLPLSIKLYIPGVEVAIGIWQSINEVAIARFLVSYVLLMLAHPMEADVNLINTKFMPKCPVFFTLLMQMSFQRVQLV